MSAWRTFAGWHAEASFWRDIYMRSVSAVIAASAIYLGAVIVGVVDWPGLLRFLLLVIPLVGGLISAVVALVAGRNLKPRD
jgi:uncharacterized protein (DUF697 family)